jgi:hypothetical protein
LTCLEKPIGQERHFGITYPAWKTSVSGSGLWQWCGGSGFLGSLALTFLGLTAVTFDRRFMAVDPVLAVVGDGASREVCEKARIAMGLTVRCWAILRV